MGSFGNIDILYMEKIQKEWDDLADIERGKNPIKFPITIEKLDLPVLGTNLENFASSPAIIKSTKIVKAEEISLKKSKRKCNKLI